MHAIKTYLRVTLDGIGQCHAQATLTPGNRPAVPNEQEGQYVEIKCQLDATEEKKEPTDDTSKGIYSLLAQHVSGIIMPIVRRQTE